MRRCLIFSVVAAAFTLQAGAQTYQVQGADGYVKPQYFLISGVSEDYAGAFNHFLAAFQRAGFDCVNSGWASGQIRSQSRLADIAQFISDSNREWSEDDLKASMKVLGHNWFDAKSDVAELVVSGHLTERTEETPTKWGTTKAEQFYSWSGEKEVPARTLAEPHTFHRLSFNYTYRESLSCGKTFVEIHGSIVDESGDRNDQLIDFHFSQPALASNCPQRVVNELVRRMTASMREESNRARTEAASEIDFRKSSGSEELPAVQSLLLMSKPGEDCAEVPASDLEDLMALGLLGAYDVIDRSVTASILEEHKLNMDGLFKESEFIEAGQLAGADAILTLQNACLGGMNVLKAKMVSVNSSLLLWSAIGKNPERSLKVDEMLDAILPEL
jgi:hypothetical protein